MTYARNIYSGLLRKKNIPFIDAGYDPENWFERINGLEQEPERGKRCTACHDVRLERAALYANEHNFRVFTTSCAISRWKDPNQVNNCGLNAAARYPGLIYWGYNWRKNGCSQRTYEIAKDEQFYKQEYCGCVYSLRDANLNRLKKGFGPIIIGTTFYRREQKQTNVETSADCNVTSL